MIREVAQVLAAEVRTHDIACRFGGEAFLLFLPGSTRAQGAEIAARIRQAAAWGRREGCR